MQGLVGLAVAAGLAISNPWRGDMVAAVGELTGHCALQGMLATMMKDMQGRRILRDRPRITNATLELCKALPEGTLGCEYSKYMLANGFLPSGRTPVQHIADPHLAYVMTRYRETHDFLHALLGAGISVLDETALKVFEWRQTGLPLGLLASIGGGLNMTCDERLFFASTLVPWALKSGDPSRTVNFLNVMWEDEVGKPVAEVLTSTGYLLYPRPVIHR
jgi:ubiquinone biosynthesis protein COQ4